MNTLKVFPKSIRNQYTRYCALLGISNPHQYHFRSLIASGVLAIIASLVFWFLYKFDFYFNILLVVLFFVIIQLFFYFSLNLKASYKVRKMEIVFPDVLQLMSSNLRAGMTVDNSLVLSARPEFSPLDEEIKKTGKEIATGRDIGSALLRMGNRIGSEKIKKTIYLIMSGLRSGGNMADLIEQTGRNMRNQEFTERKVTSGVLMYVIFIFFAVGIGGPVLFALSSVLVQILIDLLGGMDVVGSSEVSLPFMLTSIDISADFIKYFTLTFIVVTDFLASLIMKNKLRLIISRGIRYLSPSFSSPF
jgi:flagellar protein FlaJ